MRGLLSELPTFRSPFSKFQDDRNLRVYASSFALHDGWRELPLVDSCTNSVVKKSVAAVQSGGNGIAAFTDLCFHSNGNGGVFHHRTNVRRELRIDAVL